VREGKKPQTLDKIKRIERGLYLKRSQLAEVGVYEGSDPEEREKVFSQLIREIGWLSIVGNSVEEMKRERQR
jgi:hypothetical protein